MLLKAKNIYIYFLFPLNFQAGCTGDFEDWLVESDYCFQNVGDKKSWYDAQAFCSSLGGDLVAIHNNSTMTAIIQHTHDVLETRWTGLKKDQLEDGKTNQ